MMENVIVVKLGGATLGSHDTALQDMVELQKRGVPLVVVHGGGKVITDWLAKQGVASKFVQGERVTDGVTLEVVTAVLAGLVNKDIVSTINCLGGRAVGISGVDGDLIEGKIEDAGKGFVGATSKVNCAVLEVLVASGYIPVVAPVGVEGAGKQRGKPQVLNFNADTVAGDIAAALGAARLVFLTDVAGILDSSGKLLPLLSPAEAQALLASGVASGGMIPKVKACLRAASARTAACIVDGRESHALIHEIEKGRTGTTIGV